MSRTNEPVVWRTERNFINFDRTHKKSTVIATFTAIRTEIATAKDRGLKKVKTTMDKRGTKTAKAVPTATKTQIFQAETRCPIVRSVNHKRIALIKRLSKTAYST
jgi:hypothetical protein